MGIQWGRGELLLPFSFIYFAFLSMASPFYTQKQLRALLNNPPDPLLKGNRLLQHVGRWLLHHASRDYPLTAVFHDLFTFGCRSGLVSHLIYYSDTRHFYLTYLDEIHDLIDEWEAQLGEPVKVQGHRTNEYAWFGFEAMAAKLQQMLEEETVSWPSQSA